MKKLITLLLVVLYLIPQNLKAQDNDAAIAALVAIGAGIAAIEQMKEQVELEATQYILTNYPEYNKFLLKTLDFNGKKLKDMSSASVITFKMHEFEFDTLKEKRELTLHERQQGIKNSEAQVFGKRMVLFAFTSHGWINKYGVDFNKIQWHLIAADEWMNMMTAYSKLASGEDDDVKIKNVLKDGIIVNKGVKGKNPKDDIDFYKIGGDMYLVADYSEDFKFVYNERSFGIFLKETRDLIQIGRNDLIRIHEFIFED